MGHVKRDIRASAVRHDISYPYTDAGVMQLLTDIYRIQDEIDRGDVDAVCLRLDLESALGSNCLTPRQRQCVALYYYAGLTQSECAAVLGVSQVAIHARLESAITSLADYMAGYNLAVTQLSGIMTGIDLRDPLPMQRWVTEVAMNDPRWWDVPDDVWLDILARFGDQPAYVFVTRDVPERNPHGYLTDGQMRHRNRNYEICRPEIFANGNTVVR